MSRGKYGWLMGVLRQHPDSTITELVSLSGLSETTVRGHLASMVMMGYGTRRRDGRAYRYSYKGAQ